MIVIAFTLVFVPVSGVGATEATQARQAGCVATATGATPIVDLGTDLYRGAQGGLYPGGSNSVPPAHEELGLMHASQIVPRGAQGDPDPAGTIAVVSLGVSNTAREFHVFMDIAEGNIAPAVVLVNGSQGGRPIADWVDPGSDVWDGVDLALEAAGVSIDQVQAAWVKIPERIRGWDDLEPFPTDAVTYEDDLATVLRIAKTRYPNLQIAYLSSRTFGGYDTDGSPSPEPLAYENGFGVKWVIEQQIEGSLELNADPERGPVVAPWIAWGPYLWADGTTPRADGLTWECTDVQADGTHPTRRGQKKVAVQLLEHFLSAPTAVGWFSPTGEPVQISDMRGVRQRSSRRDGERGRRPGKERGRRPDRGTTTVTGPAQVPPTASAGSGQTGDVPDAASPVALGENDHSSRRSATSLSTLVILGLILVASVGVMVVALRRARREPDR